MRLIAFRAAPDPTNRHHGAMHTRTHPRACGSLCPDASGATLQLADNHGALVAPKKIFLLRQFTTTKASHPAAATPL